MGWHMDQVFHCGCLILHLSENTGAVVSVIGGIGKDEEGRTDGDVGRDWGGEAADFLAARAARCRADKAG